MQSGTGELRISELTPLMIACIMGKLSMVKKIVESARPNLKPEHFALFINIKVTKNLGGNNALLYAISSSSNSASSSPKKADQSLEIVKYLIKVANADPDSMNDYNVNCLILASKKSQIGVIEMLINCGVNIGCTDSNGNNALHIACQGGNS